MQIPNVERRRQCRTWRWKREWRDGTWRNWVGSYQANYVEVSYFILGALTIVATILGVLGIFNCWLMGGWVVFCIAFIITQSAVIESYEDEPHIPSWRK